MGMYIKKETAPYGPQIWQTDFLKTVQGGFTLDSAGFATGDVIKGGTPFAINEATRKAWPVKQAVMQAAAADDATVYKVLKGSGLTTGKYLAKTSGGAAYAISSIDSSDADYDAITLGTTLGVELAIGDVLFESSATGASAGALKDAPAGLLKQAVTVYTNTDVAVVDRGTVYENRINPISAVVKAAVPSTVIFSKSF